MEQTLPDGRIVVPIQDEEEEQEIEYETFGTSDFIKRATSGVGESEEDDGGRSSKKAESVKSLSNKHKRFTGSTRSHCLCFSQTSNRGRWR